MPSPAKRRTPRTSPRRAAAAAKSAGAADGQPPSSAARRRLAVDHPDDPTNNSHDPTLVGKRTGVALPPRGHIPLGEDGLEDPDAFFAAAKSPAGGLTSPASGGSHGSSHGPSPSKAYGRRAEKLREREREEEDRRLRREALEEEGRRNAVRGPDALHDEASEEDDVEEGVAKKKRSSYQPTPKQPGWSNRHLHRAMGVPTEDSPQYTVLSKVSTAAPSTQGSLETIATESRHARRGEQNDVQLDRLARHEEASPAALGEDEEEAPEFDGPMDPPEELSQDSAGGEKRGVDPEEREDALDPEDKLGTQPDEVVAAKLSQRSGVSGMTDPLENSLEEVVEAHNQSFGDDDDGGEGGGMQLADDADFGGGGGFDDGFGNDDDAGVDDAVSNAASRKSDKASRKSDATPEEEDEEEEEKPKKKRGRPKKNKEEAATTPTSVLRTKKSKKKKQTNKHVNFSTPNGTSIGMPAGNREYEAVPVTEYKEDYPAAMGTNVRRSRRARFKPLQFWKNEKLIYEAQNEKGLLGEAMGDMPVVAGVLTALPTPYKKVERKAAAKEEKKKGKKGKKKRGIEEEDSDDDDTRPSKVPFDDKALRKRHDIRDGESGAVWSETLEAATDVKIVSRLDHRTFSKLPLSSTRKKRESKVVGFASQAFHVPTDDDDLFPGYIAGNVVLPPRGIKDAEGVGLCSQVFNVADCQPNSLEFAIADPAGQDGEFDPKTAQRYLLSKGDMFQIPPGNVYRIENHSKTQRANLFWTIVKCTSRAEQEDSEEEED